MNAASARTVVKVCGITRLEDAQVACDAGADWLGFVMLWNSPRVTTPEVAASVLAALPDMVGVAVMVSPTPAVALATARRAGVHRLQLHRVDPATWPADFPLPTAFAVTIDAMGRHSGSIPEPGHLLLLDTADSALAGGTGRTFSWAHAARLAADRPVMLAGGLAGDNVTDALAAVRPYGVDASTRLEAAPGIKDPDQVRRFVDAVRAWDERHSEVE